MSRPDKIIRGAIRWGTCAHCPQDDEGYARPWMCGNYDRPDHKLRKVVA